jgi:hypothetical protein
MTIRYRQTRNRQKSTAYNKHIGEMSAEVTTRIFTCPFTVDVSQSCGAVLPTLRQYAGTLGAIGRKCSR